MKKTLLAALIILLASSTTALIPDYNITPGTEFNYSLNNPEPVNITYSFNSNSNVDYTLLQTNEDIEIRNYSRYTQNIEDQGNPVNVTFNWDNQKPVTIPKEIQYKPYIILENDSVFTTLNKDLEESIIKQVDYTSQTYSGWQDFSQANDTEKTTWTGLASSGDSLISGTEDGIHTRNYTLKSTQLDISQYDINYTANLTIGGDNYTTYNVTIPASCTSQEPISLKVESISSRTTSVGSTYTKLNCFNHTSNSYYDLDSPDREQNEFYPKKYVSVTEYNDLKLHADLKLVKNLETFIQTQVQPEIKGIFVQDVEKEEYSTIQVNATHPVGYNEIERAVIYVTNPDEDTKKLIARKETGVNFGNKTGVQFESIYTDTFQEGDYKVKADVIGDYNNASATGEFNVDEKGDIISQGFNFQASTFSVAGMLSIPQTDAARQIFYSFIVVVVFTFLVMIISILSDGGYSENEYGESYQKDLPNPNYNRRNNR